LEGIPITIRQFIVDNFLYGVDEEGFSTEASFLEAGYVDSIGVLEIIAFLEKEFEITVETNEMIPENLDSIHNIEQYVMRKQSA